MTQVQEEITQGVVSLSVEAGKMTADLLQKALKKVLEEMQKNPPSAPSTKADRPCTSSNSMGPP